MDTPIFVTQPYLPPLDEFIPYLQEIWNNNKNDYDGAESLILAIHEYMSYYNKDRIVMKTKMTPIECRNNYLASI